MKAPDFDYHRPASLNAAIALLAEHEDAQPIAGGQSLMPMMNFRVAAPSALIDLADVPDLRGITRTDTHIRIGAMTRYVELEALGNDIPLFAMALPHIAHDAIRNRGTIGGSLALADAAAEMPALILAMQATIFATGPSGPRAIEADEFFRGYYETALEPDEILTHVDIPIASKDQRFGFYELTQRHGDYALAGVAIAATGPTYRAAFFGVADRAIRVPTLDTALPDIDAALPHLEAIPFEGDLKASAATRKRFAGVALKRALKGMQT